MKYPYKNNIKRVSLAVLKDQKLLMVRDDDSENVFYILGGTIEANESDIECLIREIQEEIGCEIDLKSLKFLKEFKNVAHGKRNTLVTNRLYQGLLLGKPQLNSEIVEISYFNSNINKKHLSPIARNNIFPWLKKHNFIQ